jgi:hypothetical protein
MGLAVDARKSGLAKPFHPCLTSSVASGNEGVDRHTEIGGKVSTNNRRPLRPPAPPWQALRIDNSAPSPLSFYYSDDLSPLPVRGITKPRDNKSDPNIETLTYGLFSTCARAMRWTIVQRGSPYLFFVTTRAQERGITGYYQFGWYANLGPAEARDVALAAEDGHFLAQPIPIARVRRELGIKLSSDARSPVLLAAKHARGLRRMIRRHVNALQEYLSEIDRLERFNLKYGGYRYVGWKRSDKFDWEGASKYLSPHVPESTAGSGNSSPTGWWSCQKCKHAFPNVSRLRSCPNCGSLETLRPSTPNEVQIARARLESAVQHPEPAGRVIPRQSGPE